MTSAKIERSLRGIKRGEAKEGEGKATPEDGGWTCGSGRGRSAARPAGKEATEGIRCMGEDGERRMQWKNFRTGIRASLNLSGE